MVSLNVDNYREFNGKSIGKCLPGMRVRMALQTRTHAHTDRHVENNAAIMAATTSRRGRRMHKNANTDQLFHK